MSVECCANGCSSRSDLNPEIAFYQFPEEKERCHDWLDSIVREDLKQLSIEQICNDYYVCALHFDDTYLQTGLEGVSVVEDEVAVEQVHHTDNTKKDMKEFLNEGEENILLEDGKTQLVYVEGIGHIRLKTETEDNTPTPPTPPNKNIKINKNKTTTPPTNDLNLYSGKDYMLCIVDPNDTNNNHENQYVVKQADQLLKVFDSNNNNTTPDDPDNNDFHILDNGVTRVKYELPDVLSNKDPAHKDAVLDDIDYTEKAFSYLCHTCGENFEDLSELSSHMTEQHSGVSSSVNTAGCSVIADANTNDRSFQCNECKQVFTMFDQLRTHVRNHVQTRNFACDVCSAAFSHRSNLSRHKQQHCSAKKYQCDQCGKGFTQKSNLVTHQQTVHSAFMHLQTLSSLARPGAERVHRKPKVHACGICGKSFVSLTGLKNHGALHTGDRPYVCAMCNKSFTLMSCLKTHMATIHTGKKHFCELCGKSYQSEHYLKIHLRIHSGIKDFECESCSKRFIDLPSLKLHTRTHTGEKPFNCRVCSRSFTQQSHLKTHMRVHTGEKPYECKDCGKYFRQLSNVLEHSRTHRKPTN